MIQEKIEIEIWISQLQFRCKIKNHYKFLVVRKKSCKTKTLRLKSNGTLSDTKVVTNYSEQLTLSKAAELPVPKYVIIRLLREIGKQSLNVNQTKSRKMKDQKNGTRFKQHGFLNYPLTWIQSEVCICRWNIKLIVSGDEIWEFVLNEDFCESKEANEKSRVGANSNVPVALLAVILLLKTF